MLARLGYAAEVVDNGRAAVAAAAGAYAAVLMDCQLPGMDGYQATAEIRRREGADRHLPIIAMTAADTQDERARCLAAGMDDYLAKPVLLAELAAALARRARPAAPVAPPVGDAGPPDAGVLALFRATAPSDLARLRAALDVGDATGVDRAAHHLKGAAGTVGLGRVVALCRQLELLGSAGALGTAPAVLSQLEEEFERWSPVR
jgi:CheY-like chemotaxis protein